MGGARRDPTARRIPSLRGTTGVYRARSAIARASRSRFRSLRPISMALAEDSLHADPDERPPPLARTIEPRPRVALFGATLVYALLFAGLTADYRFAPRQEPAPQEIPVEIVPEPEPPPRRRKLTPPQPTRSPAAEYLPPAYDAPRVAKTKGRMARGGKVRETPPTPSPERSEAAAREDRGRRQGRNESARPRAARTRRAARAGRRRRYAAAAAGARQASGGGVGPVIGLRHRIQFRTRPRRRGDGGLDAARASEIDVHDPSLRAYPAAQAAADRPLPEIASMPEGAVIRLRSSMAMAG